MSTQHMMFWGLNNIPEGMWTNGGGHDLHQWLMDAGELGERVCHALENEFMGMGPLFDLQYEEYLREKGVLI